MSKRDRSFRGCSNCRVQKRKCDERKPSCGRCARTSRRCDYAASIHFLLYETSTGTYSSYEDVDRGTRRSIYSVDQMARSSKLIHDTFSYWAGACLELNPEDSPVVQIGPCGVFSLHESSHQPISSPHGRPSTEVAQDAVLPVVEHNGTVDRDGNAASQQHRPSSRSLSTIQSMHPNEHYLGDLLVPVAAGFHLVEHYKNMLDQGVFSPLYMEESPWSMIQLPFAQRVLLNVVSGAPTTASQKAILSAILAVSAFQLNNSLDTGSNKWLELGNKLKQSTLWHLRLHLSTNKANSHSQYTETLMALLAMVSAIVMRGELKDARCFLLDAEKLIYLQGLSQASSPLAKTLHHIFLFNRLIEESTHIYPRHVLPSIEALQTVESLAFPSLQTCNLCLGYTPVVSLGSDFEDKLFGGSGCQGSGNLNIYGVPNKLLSLLSRTTQLAHQLSAARYSGLDPEPFRQHGLALKEEIIYWQQSESFWNLQNPKHCLVAYHHNRAMQIGVFIYFQRRILDVDPLTLQDHVLETLYSLESCRTGMMQMDVINCGFQWPAFVAGAEAVGNDLQGRFRTFLRQSARISGIGSFDVAANVLEQVWDRRKRKGNMKSWMCLVEDKGLPLMLT